MPDKIIVIYHRADFDGIFCREIARKHFESIYACVADRNVEYIGWDYGDAMPKVESDSEVYMLDISVDGLMEHPSLVWIDHHKSAIDKYSDEIVGYRIDGVAACRLAWQWFFHAPGMGDHPTEMPFKSDFVNRKVEEPEAIRLAGEYDIWDKRDSNAELFQHGLRSKALTPYDWRMLLSETVDTAIVGTGMEIQDSALYVTHLMDAGRSIQYAKTQENAGIITSYGFTASIDGLTVLACNHARFNSHLFTAGLKPEHEACLGYNFDGKQWKVSLYHAPGKEHHDLSLIAVKHGGGGHRGECGFRSLDLSFLTLTQPH